MEIAIRLQFSVIVDDGIPDPYIATGMRKFIETAAELSSTSKYPKSIDSSYFVEIVRPI